MADEESQVPPAEEAVDPVAHQSMMRSNEGIGRAVVRLAVVLDEVSEKNAELGMTLERERRAHAEELKAIQRQHQGVTDALTASTKEALRNQRENLENGHLVAAKQLEKRIETLETELVERRKFMEEFQPRLLESEEAVRLNRAEIARLQAETERLQGLVKHVQVTAECIGPVLAVTGKRKRRPKTRGR